MASLPSVGLDSRCSSRLPRNDSYSGPLQLTRSSVLFGIEKLAKGDPVNKKVTTLVMTAIATTVLAGGAIAIAGNDSEGGVTGPNADRATAAALDATGGGTANAVERDDENGATWEVEVTKPDGTTVDVRLDSNFEVVIIEGDAETEDDGDADE